jgi:hypothetical protein
MGAVQPRREFRRFDIPAASRNSDFEWDFYEKKTPIPSAELQKTATFVYNFAYISLSTMEEFLNSLLCYVRRCLSKN